MSGSVDMGEPSLARRTAWGLVVAAAAVFGVLAWLWIPWEQLPGGRVPRVDPRDHFSADELARAERHAAVVRRLGWASTALTAVVAVGLMVSPRGVALVRKVVRSGRWWALPMTALLVLVAVRLLTLPLSYLVRRENLRVGLTEQAFGPWLWDRAVTVLVGWAVLTLLSVVVVVAARWSPRRWFVGAGAVSATVTLGLSLVYPLVVEPLYNRFDPLPAGDLRNSLLDLADQEGLEVGDVLIADASRRTTTLNAYVSGFAGTRRIVLNDNLVADVPADQVRVVVAHELVHARESDVLRGTVLAAAGLVVGVALLALLLDAGWFRRRTGVRGPTDAALPVVLWALMTAVTLATSPVQSTMSRAVEARADWESLRMVSGVSDQGAQGAAAAFMELQRQLAVRSLADPTPPGWSHVWFGSHPTVLQRLGIATAWERGR